MKSRSKLSALVLSSALVGGGCFITAEDVFGEVLDRSADRVNNQLAGDVIRGASNIVRKSGERRAKHKTELRESDVDIYREKGLSRIRIEEEREMKKIYNESPSGSQADTKTNQAIRKILGKDLDTRTVIEAVVREYKGHPFDWERNVKIIERTYELEGLTSGDRNRLKEIIESMYWCTQGRIEMIKRLYSNRDNYAAANREYRLNKRRIMGDFEGRIILYEFMINHPDIDSRFKRNARYIRKRLLRKIRR